jgi:hypothetical protein
MVDCFLDHFSLFMEFLACKRQHVTPCTMCSLDRSYTESEFLSGTHLKLN